ncbi:MAG: nucleoside-diphosphate kinase [Candidatus Diapherotrites archaeon]
MGTQRTFVILKPDCVLRGLVGKVLQKFEDRGLKIVAMKMIQLDDKILAEHYAHHKDKKFYPKLTDFMKLSPVITVVLEGENAVDTVRNIAGKTDGSEAGTIRNEFSPNEIQENILHASDALETAKTEIERFFRPGEISSYDNSCEKLKFSRV